MRFIKRSVTTALKLPFAMAWDLISLGNMGEGASTSKVLQEHRDRKQIDDMIEVLEAKRDIQRATGELK
jgi:hypothetical protein